MKKLFYITLLIALPLSLAACSNNKSTSSPSVQSSRSSSTAKVDHSKQVSKEDNSSSKKVAKESSSPKKELVTDPKIIGLLAYGSKWPDGTLSSLQGWSYGEDSNGYAWSQGTSPSTMSYTIEGGTITYSIQISYGNYKKYTDNIADLVAKYYSTDEQKRQIQAIIDNAENMDDQVADDTDTSSNSDEDTNDADDEDTDDSYDAEDDDAENVSTTDDYTDDYDE